MCGACLGKENLNFFHFCFLVFKSTTSHYMSAVVMGRHKSHVFLPIVQWRCVRSHFSTEAVSFTLVFPSGSPSLCNSLDFS